MGCLYYLLFSEIGLCIFGFCHNFKLTLEYVGVGFIESSLNLVFRVASKLEPFIKTCLLQCSWI